MIPRHRISMSFVFIFRIRSLMSEAVAGKFTRRDHLLEIEGWAQKQWRENRVYQKNAKSVKGPKYMATFPYPYMNGRVHLGHAFTVTKAEFAVRFQSLQGKDGFFPFAFHCTGMPIQAAAGNLKRELAQDGEEEILEAVEAEPTESAVPAERNFRSKKSKAKAKSGGMTQAKILESMGIPCEDLPLFAEPSHWLEYFPPLGQEDLSRFGVAIDWRRSFITTDKNPYYDQFIRWQFRKLKEGGFIGFGNRPAVFSRREQQPCADHDRQSGEGVNPQEYTLIKLRVTEVPDVWGLSQPNQAVHLVAATLRPETMYGQTNCFVLPDGEYGIFDMGKDQGYFICSKRSADNMVWQGLGHRILDIETGLEGASAERMLTGKDLIGLAVSAPLAQYDRVYVLPMLTISMNKGTGVVTSVPSDAPDDFACLRDWQIRSNWRDQYKVDPAWCDFKPIDIITIPEFPKMEELIAEHKVESHKDKDKLEVIKKMTYLKGFEYGIMNMGKYAGRLVKEAKPLVRADLLAAGMAVAYFEPDGPVMSRSGDECVVALCDQWFINYGEPQWMSQVLGHLKSEFQMFNKSALNQQIGAVEWFKAWACSRSFGLGTRLPWDEKWIIESLSDSTIYMAYYTIAHFLQGNMEGSLPGLANMRPEQVNDALFDYVFCLSDQVPAGVPLVEEMRNEFQYWYPMDLRVSGKDLIPNHLTMALYVHAAIWKNQPEYWPRGFFTNGHIEVDSQKMSKSLGNFLTLTQVCADFGADATRIGLADAGDDLENANFSKKTANDTILALTTLENWISEWTVSDDLRNGELSFVDQLFDNEMNKLVHECEAFYGKMGFRGALKACWFDIVNLREQYRLLSDDSMHAKLVHKYSELQTVMLFPIAPHFCEHLWQRVLKQNSSLAAAGKWPSVTTYDLALGRQFQVLQESLRNFRLELKKWKGAEPPKQAVVFVAKEYLPFQQKVLRMISEAVAFDSATHEPLDKKYIAKLKELLPTGAESAQALKFAAYHIQNEVKARGVEALELNLPFDESAMLGSQEALIKKQLGVSCLVIAESTNAAFDPQANAKVKREAAIPARPTIVFMTS